MNHRFKAIAMFIALAAGALVTVLASSPSTVPRLPKAASTSPSTAPATPGPVVCGDVSLLAGPSSAPAGAVTVTAGTNDSLSPKSDTTYWLAPGVHTLGTGVYDQIDPAAGDTFIGAPGAILSGQSDNDTAFGGSATDVTIEQLTVENFVAPQSEGVVNHNSGASWTIENNTIEDNPKGAGVMLGTDDVLSGNCLTENGQYGFQSYSTGTGPKNVTVTGNEISYNDTANYTTTTPGCGCTGGAKFWDTDGATVTGNYVHNNYSVGLWADTDNVGFNFSGNYFSTNYGEGIIYEISYNAKMADNTFVRNALGVGPTNPAFPTGAIYISESGSDSRVAGTYGTTLDISGNVFTDNWSGVVLWENANRYCGSSANTSSGSCTLVNPSTYTVTSCKTNVPTSKSTGTPDYFDNCRWKTQNVSVSDNTFNFTPTAIGPTCTAATGCGFNALFSEYGTYPPFTGWVVPNHISNDQNNHFSDNTYTGPWSFLGFNQGDIVSWAQWTAGFTDTNGSDDHFGAQDAGSTLNGSAATPDPPPATTTTTTSTTGPPATTTTTTTSVDPPATSTPVDPPASSTSPGAPTHLVDYWSSKMVLLEWDAPKASKVTTYTVLRGTSASNLSVLAAGIPAPDMYYFDSSGVARSTYYYEVKAVNSAGTGHGSNEVSITIPNNSHDK